MTRRVAIATCLATLLIAHGAEAKMRPTFSESEAAPGDRVRVELGVDAERYLASLRVYLVPIEEAATTKGQSSPYQTMVAEFRGRAAGAVPRAFDFEVPRLRPGLYASEIWYRGEQTDWYEVSGIQPRVTIRDSAAGAGMFGLVDAAANLLAALRPGG